MALTKADLESIKMLIADRDPQPLADPDAFVTHTDLSILAAEVADMRRDIAGMVTAWNTATGMLSFVKWAAGIAAACLGVWVAIKELVK